VTDAADAEASLPPETTRADFYTGRYCLSADVHTGDRRLIDVLRDQTRRYLELRRVRSVALDAEESPIHYAHGLLNKVDIEWATVRAEPLRAEARLYGFVKKAPVPVSVVLGTCRIEGMVHVESGSTDPAAFFIRSVERERSFILITAATVTPPSLGGEEKLGLAIVNASAIRFFSASRV
jgi:hypothetical protein